MWQLFGRWLADGRQVIQEVRARQMLERIIGGKTVYTREGCGTELSRWMLLGTPLESLFAQSVVAGDSKTASKLYCCASDWSCRVKAELVARLHQSDTRKTSGIVQER
jgi:hypothetical protein